MPNQSKEFQQDLLLPGHRIPTKTPEDLPTGVQLQSTGFLPGQHHVSSDILSTTLHFRQGDSVPQKYNTSQVSSQILMPGLLESDSIVEPLLVEAANVSLSNPENHASNVCSTTHRTSTTDRNCLPLQTGDSQQQFATYETLTDFTPRPLQTEDHQNHHRLEDSTSILPDDLELGNDSSSNELDENGMESELKDDSGFQPPTCSSRAFSLMMADSEHNPSTSGYSSEQPAKVKTQKELMKILKELRSYLPPEKKFRGKFSTAASLRYALHCIQQVKANEDYYQLLMINNNQPCGQDLSCYTVEEIANLTSEYTKNNMDVFAAAVSLVTGRILYISEQASVVLRCNADLFSNVRFVELLAPQDVNVFYSSTNPYRLPSWSICNGGDLGYLDGLEEKSFYCRISCGQWSRREVSYHPFRLTPYLIRIQTETDGGTAEQLCCILFAERVRSGYEAPRILADKRIFTTTHTPSCIFQDVDERAVPLLGYLPQDLIGSPIFLHLHPSDRPLMLAVHKKILQYGGQPFDFSPIRFCARNGEYITVDTSWSSFINPWSRKVSFIIGRHKVRMGPVNEDLFTAPPRLEEKSLQPGIQELTEQIHQLLMQPVHNGGSSGYGSLGSHGSHENPMSGASSSDGNGNLNDDVKEKQGTPPVCGRKGPQASTSLETKDHRNLKITPETCVTDKVNRCSKDVNGKGSGMAACPLQCDPLPAKPPPYSYQQINCLDSVIRYLESCSVLASERKKIVSPGSMEYFASNNQFQMQDQRDSTAGSVVNPKTGVASTARCLQSSLPGSAITCKTVPGSLPHLSLTSLPVSGAAITQLSMGAKAKSVVSLTSHCSYSSTIVHVGDKKLHPETEDGPLYSEVLPPAPASTEKEPYKWLGLTKEVLVAHTQKEENDFLSGFMDSKKLSAFKTRCNSYMHDRPGANTAVRRSGKARKAKVKRVRPESWDSSSSGVPQAHRPPLPGLNTTAWSQSDTSHASYHPLSYPMLPAYPLPVFPPPQISVPNEIIHGGLSTTLPMQPFPTPLLSPMVAVVLPNYIYPPGMAPSVFPGTAPQHPFPVQPSLFAPQPAMTPSNATFPVPLHTFPVPPPVCPPAPHVFPVPAPSSVLLSAQSPCSVQPFSYPVPPNEPKMRKGFSRSSTPQDPQSSPLFQSRCSSPLQLNLLQLEESQKTDRSEGGTGGAVNCTFMPQTHEDPELQARSPADAHNSDALSTGSDLMDILLQEDALSATCSASSEASECLTSGSNGNGTSGSQTGSSQTSRSSKYFGSVDSSENNQKGRGATPSTGESVMKYVLQDPMWLLMANADENVMMTYQIPQRDIDSVLREDRKKLKSMQKLQPRFTEDQRKELGEIHPWIQRGGLPWAVEGCVFCKEKGVDCSEYSGTIQELELSGIMESCD
ncbi:period circadian protein homolog 2-like isoform X2 [Rana temporaria]|uniref:period circadian protein homolog 2-like isoform X2 n=1 Tax=Rana temporaria TaxID=8407 RepID=UPI001AAD4312|nr:period circadian protein homolog 2-like isoform X2 [Rana temporaria]